jgi:hypothetical protein
MLFSLMISYTSCTPNVLTMVFSYKTPTGNPYPHVGQSYANDLVGVAVSGASLQRIINVVHAHSNRWQWDANVTRSHVTVFNPQRNVQRMRGPVAL